MTIDEAIAHANEKAESLCGRCGKEHKQLAKWLTEYKGLKEKQIPKKPQDVNEDYGTFDCPSCLSTIYATDDMRSHSYCLICGQKLDWSEKGDTE